MFTGLVEEVGQIALIEEKGASARFVIRAPKTAAHAKIGESIAVNGCCLTVVQISGETICFDLLAETVRLTNFRSLQADGLVNLEPSLPANGKMGGHFVSAHVDAVAEILAWEPQGADWMLDVALAPEFAKWVVHKGCIAIDGISLTVAELTEGKMRFWIIPHTYAETALRARGSGSLVNIEFDLLAKYVEKILAARA